MNSGSVSILPIKAVGRRVAIPAAALLASLVADASEEPLRLGISRSMIATLDPGDAKVTLDRVMAMTGLGTTEFKTRIFSSDAEFLTAVEKGNIDFFAMHALDLISGRNLETMEPVVIPARDSDKPLVRYVLLAHRENPAKTLADFSGTEFHYQKSFSREVDALWLDVILGEAGLPERAEFFGAQTEVSSAGRAITAVFFRKADLCLTTEDEWDTLAELNPQLKLHLRAVARSEPLLTAVMCFQRSYRNSKRDIVVKEMLKMHETVRGKQLLTITRTDRMVTFEESSIDSLVKLHERHRQVMAARKTEAPMGIDRSGPPAPARAD